MTEGYRERGRKRERKPYCQFEGWRKGKSEFSTKEIDIANVAYY